MINLVVTKEEAFALVKVASAKKATRHSFGVRGLSTLIQSQLEKQVDTEELGILKDHWARSFDAHEERQQPRVRKYVCRKCREPKTKQGGGQP